MKHVRLSEALGAIAGTVVRDDGEKLVVIIVLGLIAPIEFCQSCFLADGLSSSLRFQGCEWSWNWRSLIFARIHQSLPLMNILAI